MRGSRTEWRVLGLAFLFLLGLAAGLGWRWNRAVDELLAQREALRRTDGWVSLARLPPFVPASLEVVAAARPPVRDAWPDPAGWGIALDLVRQAFGLGDGVWDGVRAVGLAALLRARLDRPALLEFDLNRSLWGRWGGVPVWGVRRAAELYAGVPPERLTLGQATALVGLRLSPPLIEPARAPGPAGARRFEVLRALVDVGAIDAGAAWQAAREPLPFRVASARSPVTRPPQWWRPPPVVRVPASLRSPADTLP